MRFNASDFTLLSLIMIVVLGGLIGAGKMSGAQELHLIEENEGWMVQLHLRRCVSQSNLDCSTKALVTFHEGMPTASTNAFTAEAHYHYDGSPGTYMPKTFIFTICLRSKTTNRCNDDVLSRITSWKIG